MAYKIDAKCIKCGACADTCPVEAISGIVGGKEIFKIDPATCVDCGACESICPVSAISPK